jgi:hypothetical protein
VVGFFPPLVPVRHNLKPENGSESMNSNGESHHYYT